MPFKTGCEHLNALPVTVMAEKGQILIGWHCPDCGEETPNESQVFVSLPPRR